MSKRILLTGGTGFVGSFLAYRLLQEGCQIKFLARAHKNQSAKERIDEALEFVGPSSYFKDQYGVIEGDITEERLCGINVTDVDFLKKQEITKIVHGAGSVKFDEELLEETWKINFTGTKNVLSLAKELKAKEFHYLSTAYAPTKRNPYEKSKAAAEDLLKKSGVSYSISRLSITIGDSKTGYAKGFNGYYGFFAGPYRIAEKIRKRKNFSGEVQLPIYIDCSFESTLNLVPIDWVVQNLSALINSPCQNDTYYIVHPDPPKVQWVMEQGFETLNIEGIKYNDYKKYQPEQEDRRLRIIQKAVNRELERYRPYVTEEEKFCLEKMRQYLGTNYTNPPPITSQLLSMLLKFAIERNLKN